MVGTPLHCPSTLDLPSSAGLILASNVINPTSEPLFTYYASSNASMPVDPGTLAAENANSVVLTLRIDDPADFTGPVLKQFTILFGGAIVTRSIANGAVTDAKLAGSIAPAKIANDSIGAGALTADGGTTFDDIPVASNSTHNFAPNDSGELERWHDNALSPATTRGGVSFTAGDANAASMTVNWGGLCRSGFELDARGLYTVYNPPGSGPVNVGVRLIGSADLGTGSEFASILTEPIVIPGDQYVRQASDWQQIDLGHCSDGNFLIKHSSFLYHIQTRSNQLQPYGVVNAIIELRYTPEVPPTNNPVPLAAEALSPLSDSDVTVSSSVTLTGRFMDTNPDENDGLLEFQLCDTTDCATPLDSGQTQGGIGNGGLGNWQSSYRLVADHDYYWRVRGVDHAGQKGPWSDDAIIHAIS